MIQVSIPTEFEQFVQCVVESGNYHDHKEVVGEALRLLQRRERLMNDVKAGVEQLQRGEYAEYGEDSFKDFLDDVKAEEQTRFPEHDSTQ